MSVPIVLRILGVLLILFSFHSGCTSTHINYEAKLVRKLLYDYDTSVRPSRNATEPLNVTFGLALTQIIDVDERNQILTTNCWLNQMWMDYSLQWNSSEYGGINVIRIPADKVWKPDIILYNNADSQYNLAILSTNVIVRSSGNLTWLSTVIFKSSCQINVEYFPFDEQQCDMKFASWTYDGFQVNLVIQTEEGDLSNYVSNGEWDLILMEQKRHVVYYSCCTEPYPDVTYSIVLRRRPLFYVFNLILPCVLISGLALLSFYMPSDSGEKVTLGITTLLSMTVFLMVIGESMPPTSEKLPLVGLYYGVTISLVSFATGLSVVTLNIHHRGMRGRQLPSAMRKFLFNFLARILFLRLDFPKREIIQDQPPTGSGSRRIPVGDTWRIVYPDMPSTPPNFCSCEAHSTFANSWRRNRPTTGGPHMCGSSYGNLNRARERYGSCCGGTSSHFRPVMKVRGIPLDASDSHQHLPHSHPHHYHHMTTRDDISVNGKSTSNDFETSFPSSFQPNSNPAQSSSSSSIPLERHLSCLLERVVLTMEKNEERMAHQDKQDVIKLEWQMAALVIDRLLLWLFMIATVGATFGILYMSPHTKLFSM